MCEQFSSDLKVRVQQLSSVRTLMELGVASTENNSSIFYRGPVHGFVSVVHWVKFVCVRRRRHACVSMFAWTRSVCNCVPVVWIKSIDKALPHGLAGAVTR